MLIKNQKQLLGIALILSTLCTPALTAASNDEIKRATEFLRYQEVGADGGQLQTAIVTYRNEKGVEVTLVGAVHIADGTYYRHLNKLFKSYDALLYELIAPPNQRPQRGQQSSSFIGLLQRAMKRVLGLEFQLDGIDYSKKNFVHADMDPRQFRRAQQERGEGFLDMFLKIWMRSMQDQMSGKGVAGLDPNELMRALSSDDIQRSLKILLAGEMQNIEALMAGISDENGESVILTERNKVAFEVLRKEMKKHRKLGIFYGAAHLPDMEERLLAMGFKLHAHEWLTAWNMPPTKDSAQEPADTPTPSQPKPTQPRKRERF
ncbi:MAG: hypothetical protein AAF581_09550 [Planctomycetota bacterium]